MDLGRMRERGSEPYLRVGKEDRSRGDGDNGLPVADSVSLTIGLGLGRAGGTVVVNRTICAPTPHLLLYGTVQRGSTNQSRLDASDQSVIKGLAKWRST